MVSENTFEKMRHGLKSEFSGKIGCKDLPTEAVSILRELYGLRIADMDGIHKHVLNMKEISDVCLPPLFLENLYGIIGSYEGKLTEAMSYFLQGRPIVPTLSRLELKDKSQANIMWQIIRLHTLVEKEQKDLVEHGKEITSQTNMGKAFWNTDIKMSVGIDGSEKSGL